MEIEKHPDTEVREQTSPAEMLKSGAVQPIGPEQLKRFTEILEQYKAGNAQTAARIIASENCNL